MTHTCGLILSYEMASANIDERDVFSELVHDYKGLIIADKDLIRPSLKKELVEYGLGLQTPLRDYTVCYTSKKMDSTNHEHP